MPTWGPLCAQVTLAGSTFDTLLGVYTGSSVASLTRIGGNNDCELGGTLTSCWYVLWDGQPGHWGPVWGLWARLWGPIIGLPKVAKHRTAEADVGLSLECGCVWT
jgi:hypothetical protein